jgi:hypothetical protein
VTESITMIRITQFDSPRRPVLIIQFVQKPEVELHLWLFKGKSQVEWLTEQGRVLGVQMGADC